MTDKQMHFIVWLVTTATDKCKDMNEVRKLNEEIQNIIGINTTIQRKGNPR